MQVVSAVDCSVVPDDSQMASVGYPRQVDFRVERGEFRIVPVVPAVSVADCLVGRGDSLVAPDG